MSAFRVLRRLRDLLDVDTTGATVGDALVLDADGETWVPGAGGGGSDDQTAAQVPFTPAGTVAATDVQAAIEEVSGDVTSTAAASVILAPGSSARNVIQPTAGSVIAAVLKAHASQATDLLQIQTSAGSVLLAVDQLGRITSGAAVGAAVGAVDLNPSSAPVSATDVYGSTLPLALGMRIIAEGTLTANTPTAQFQGLQSVMKGPTSDKTHGILFGADVATIFRGTKALAGAQQVSSLIGGRFAALDYDYTASGDDATGTIYSILGVEPYASHGGQSSVNNVIGAAAYAEAQQLLGVTPGPVAGFIAGVTSLIATDTSIGTLPAMYGYHAERTTFSNTAITLAAAYYAKNYGLSGTVNSYGLYVEAQTGSTNPYGIYVAGGRSVFVDTLLTGKTSAPADADIGNSQGGWWWDAANSVPKWKGKQAGGTVVNFTPTSLTEVAAAYQPLDADLTAIAGLADPNADRILFWDDSAGAYKLLAPGTNLTITGTTIDAAGGIAASLFDANTILKADSDDTPVALTLGANTFPARSSSGSILAKTITDFGLSLVDDADAVAARATIGVDNPWQVLIHPVFPPYSNTGYSTFYQWDGGGGAADKHVLLVRYSNTQNDEIAWNVMLGAGTWAVDVMGDSGPDRGIGTVTLGSIGTLGTMDGYSGGYVTGVVYSITGITVPTTGVYLLKFKQATKHASSAGYAFPLGWVQMRRTA